MGSMTSPAPDDPRPDPIAPGPAPDAAAEPAADAEPAAAPAAAPAFGAQRADLWLQILLVLGVSLGASALWSVLQLGETLATSSIAESQAALNPQLSPHPVFDVLRRSLGIVLALVPPLLALYLLAGSAGQLRAVLRRIGLDLRLPGADIALGVLLLLIMGLGTVGLYQAGRALGITAELTTNAGGTAWWEVLLLLASAARHSLVEEIIVVAFLADRLLRVGWSWPAVLIGSALLRGGYHLYQGVGPALGNVVMGLVFLWLYRRTGRLMPLVIAHFLLDAVGFLAGPLLF